jgi:hypothetical protein
MQLLMWIAVLLVDMDMCVAPGLRPDSGARCGVACAYVTLAPRDGSLTGPNSTVATTITRILVLSMEGRSVLYPAIEAHRVVGSFR